jgi:hypothetical protein
MPAREILLLFLRELNLLVVSLAGIIITLGLIHVLVSVPAPHIFGSN